MDISNKTLATLVVAAIVVSIGGTLISLNQIGTTGPIGVTGAATGSGHVDLDIQIDTTINMTANTINFGAGAVSGGYPFATLDSATGSATHWNGTFAAQFLTIQNDGNVELNITFKSDEDAAAFIGGTNPVFNYTVINDETGSCANLATAQSDVEIAPSDNFVCGNLNMSNTADAINLSIGLKIPNDATATQTATFTFTSTEA